MNKNVFKKRYNSVFISMHPDSYFNLHTLSAIYPFIPEQAMSRGESGYAKFNVNAYLYNNKDNHFKEVIVNGNLSHQSAMNGNIIPVVNFPVYIPLFDMKVDVEKNNFSRLVFFFLEAMQVFFYQYDNGMRSYEFRDEDDLQEISQQTMLMLSKAINNEDIISKIENQMKDIVTHNDFVSYDMTSLPHVMNFDDFLSLPKNLNLMTDKDKHYLENSSNIQFKNRFLATAGRLFQV